MQRKLRTAKSLSETAGSELQQPSGTDKPKYEPIDYEEELNFSLQTPEHLKSNENLPKKDAEGVKPATEEENEETPPNSSSEQQHKVTVMVHQEEADEKDSVARGDDVQHHVTVIKLQDCSERPKATPEESQEDTSKVSPTSASAAEQTSSVKEEKKFPLLPPPPASHKMRAGNAHILRPTPASPPAAKSLTVVASADVAKSRSLPR